MKIAPFIKKSLCLVLSFSILFAVSACSQTDGAFTESEDGILVSASGKEYERIAVVGYYYYFGELVFEGGVPGEPKTYNHMGTLYRNGLFSMKNDDTGNILIRFYPGSEWQGIYRDVSLPPFDFSVDNCIRLELVSGIGSIEEDVVHTTCGDGITDKSEIEEFLSDVRSQMSSREAGLYDLVRMPNGMLENCYHYAGIYGFFEEEPNLAIRMKITSFNDLAYSISIEGKEYVLPEEWLQRFQNN